MTCGIVLGAVWAGSIPEWGGFWNWDPVECASLVPWVAGALGVTAAFGALRGRPCVCPGAFLSGVAFAGTMLCAFVTRSGAIGTQHGYAGGTASAWVFVAVGTIAVCVSLAMLSGRKEAMQGNRDGRKGLDEPDAVGHSGRLQGVALEDGGEDGGEPHR